MANFDSNAVGWLIVHTENKESKTHSLKEGKNIFGRISSSGVPDIPVENDKFVSRNHASINVLKNAVGHFQYILNDNNSTNGTYVNGNSERISTAIELNDGDTIQIGETKFVLKTLDTVNDENNAANLVKKMNYSNTVAIDGQENKSPVLKRVIKR